MVICFHVSFNFAHIFDATKHAKVCTKDNFVYFSCNPSLREFQLRLWWGGDRVGHSRNNNSRLTHLFSIPKVIATCASVQDSTSFCLRFTKTLSVCTRWQVPRFSVEISPIMVTTPIKSPFSPCPGAKRGVKSANDKAEQTFVTFAVLPSSAHTSYSQLLIAFQDPSFHVGLSSLPESTSRHNRMGTKSKFGRWQKYICMSSTTLRHGPTTLPSSSLTNLSRSMIMWNR